METKSFEVNNAKILAPGIQPNRFENVKVCYPVITVSNEPHPASGVTGLPLGEERIIWGAARRLSRLESSDEYVDDLTVITVINKWFVSLGEKASIEADGIPIPNVLRRSVSRTVTVERLYREQNGWQKSPLYRDFYNALLACIKHIRRS